jgi:DNA-binding NarL/FixJ family response regulator
MRALRILLVDDSSIFLESLDAFLATESSVAIVGHARSGHAAQEQVRQVQPDLVLIDLRMPHMNGLEVTRQIKAGSAAPYVIMLTLYDTAEYRAAAAAVGADTYLTKGELRTQLLPLLARLSAERASRVAETDTPPSGAPLGES